jgi:hypothetical protein
VFEYSTANITVEDITAASKCSREKRFPREGNVGGM